MIDTVIKGLFTILLLTGDAAAQNAIKRGQYSFAAFIYYTDEAITDASGERFLQSAVLIKLDWLVSASIDPLILEGTLVGFPDKTLMARAGAITMDSKFTLNEDEDEQEREVVQVVRPHGHVAEKAVSSDITLLKTLLPFASTPAVGVANMNTGSAVLAESCTILVFNPKPSGEEQILIEMIVEMHKNKEVCGPEFEKDLMLCGNDSEESKSAVDENHYCHGNAGGALICNGKVAGIQSYIHQVCRQPHLFNLFFGWRSFIHCGEEEKCKEDSCSNVCSPVYKDETKPFENIELTSSISPELVAPTEPTTHVDESTGTTTKVDTDTTIDAATSPTIQAKTSTTELQTTTVVTTSSTEPSMSTVPTTDEVSSTISTISTSTSTSLSTSTTTTTQCTIPTTVSDKQTHAVPSLHKLFAQDIKKAKNDTKVPDLNERKPNIEARKDPKVVEIAGRSKNAMNSSSAHFMNGMLIIFLNLVVAI